MLKPALIIAAVAPLVLIISVVLHNVISGWLGREEPFFFFVAVIVAPLAFAIGLIVAVIATVEAWRGKHPSPR